MASKPSSTGASPRESPSTTDQQMDLQTQCIMENNCILEEHRIVLEWQDLSCSLPLPVPIVTNLKESIIGEQKRKRVLYNVSGNASPGELIGLLGPPNSGKTTLLNLLGGIYVEEYSGDITVNGRPLDPNEICTSSCFVPQKDEVIQLDNFSVKEMIWMAVEMKFPSGTARRIKFRNVINQLSRFSLTEVRRCPLSKLSHFHRRMLTLGMELIRQQPLILLDDPFRNVDPYQAQQIMKALRYLAYRGHTVICAMNFVTSDIYKYFTKLYILAEGRLLFSGLPKELPIALRACNFVVPPESNMAEHIMKVTSKMYGGVKILADREASHSKSSPSAPTVIKHQPQFEETKGTVKSMQGNIGYVSEDPGSDARDFFSLLFNRCLFFTFRNPTAMSLRQAFNIITIILFASIFKSSGIYATYTEHNVGFISLFISTHLLFSLINSVIKGPLLDDYGFYEQPRSLYSPLVYFVSRIAADLVFELIFTLSSSVFLYYLTFQVKEEGRVFFYLVTMLSHNLQCHAMGLFLSLFMSRSFSFFFAVGIFLYNLIFSGALFQFSKMAKWLTPFPYASVTFYARTMLLIVIYGKDRSIECADPDSTTPANTTASTNATLSHTTSSATNSTTCAFGTGTEVLKMLHVDEAMYYPGLAFLVGGLLIFLVLSFWLFTIRLQHRIYTLK